jgi:hypothetical protein
VKFHDYWTIIVDGRTVGEDLVITELTKTSGAYNSIPWSNLVEWSIPSTVLSVTWKERHQELLEHFCLPTVEPQPGFIFGP